MADSAPKVWINGSVVPLSEARVSIEDAGFQHGVGLFETMAVFHGRVFQFDEHMARLGKAAAELGLVRELDTAGFADAIATLLEVNGLSAARVRITVTAGEVSLLKPPGKAPVPPTVLVMATPPTQYDPRYFEQGITLAIAGPLANPFDPHAGHKTLNYWSRLRTLRQAAARGAGEALWLNVTNHLASGAISNLMLVKDGQLLTPFAHGEEVEGALNAPVLPGTIRALVLDMAAERGISVQRKMLSIEDLLAADEVFLTNSSWLVLPVTHVEQHAVASAKVGPVTQALRQAVLETIARACPET